MCMKDNKALLKFTYNKLGELIKEMQDVIITLKSLADTVEHFGLEDKKESETKEEDSSFNELIVEVLEGIIKDFKENDK